VVTASTRRASRLDRTCEKEGGKIVDGRGFTLQGHEKGFYVGPTLIDHVTPEMDSYHNEIFGPVLQIVRAPDFEARWLLPPPIWQRRGDLHPQRPCRARIRRAGECGHGGINVPIPVPVAYHSFGGWKRSAFGDTNQHGMEGVKFWTKIKTVTAAGPMARRGGNAFIIPRWADGMIGQFSLTEDQQAIQAMARRFTADAITPLPRAGTRHIFPREVIARGELGFGAIYVGEAQGGIGLSRLEAALVIEALAHGCPATAPSSPSTTWPPG
jgi:hypothetical protein